MRNPYRASMRFDLPGEAAACGTDVARTPRNRKVLEGIRRDGKNAAGAIWQHSLTPTATRRDCQIQIQIQAPQPLKARYGGLFS
jgi:hypothetical protein